MITHGVLPAQPLQVDDRVMCRYAGDTALDVFEIYTITDTIEINGEMYVALDKGPDSPWARWRFEKVIGGQ